MRSEIGRQLGGKTEVELITLGLVNTAQGGVNCSKSTGCYR